MDYFGKYQVPMEPFRISMDSIDQDNWSSWEPVIENRSFSSCTNRAPIRTPESREVFVVFWIEYE